MPGLTKPVEVNNSGVSAEHWEIVGVRVDVILGGFKDQAARDAGKNPIANAQFSFTGAELGLQDARQATDMAIYQSIARAESGDLAGAVLIEPPPAPGEAGQAKEDGSASE